MSKRIVILGAGRSSSSLIRHLLQNAGDEGFTVRIGDLDPELAARKAEGHPAASTFALDAGNPEARRKEIEAADLVISMLPAFLHPEVARDAIATRTPLITPSYLSPEIAAMDAEAKAAAARAGFAYPGWEIERQREVLVMARGTRFQRGRGFQKGMFPDCREIAKRVRR